MTHDPTITATYERHGQTVDTSRNIGQQQAAQGGPCSGQQAGESYSSYMARQGAYIWAKQQQTRQG